MSVMENIRATGLSLDADRQIALDHWKASHEIGAAGDADTLHEAALRAPLIDTDDGARFEPESFGELITFIAELPF